MIKYLLDNLMRPGKAGAMTFRPAVLLGILLAAATAVRADDSFDGKKWNGTWTVKRLQVEGVDAPTDLRNKVTVVIDGNQMTVKGFDAQDVKNTFSLKTSSRPGQIDLTPARANSPAAKGIYQFDGNTLSICVSDTGDRPGEFATKTKSGQVLMVLEKAQ